MEWAEALIPFPSWRLSGWQREPWNLTEDLALPRLVLFNCGRGAGKDILAIRSGLRDLFKLYRERQAIELTDVVRNPTVAGAILAPSERALRQTVRDFEGELRGMARDWRIEDGDLFQVHRKDGRFSILGPNEITMEPVVTSRPDSLRGPGWDVVLYTEFAAEKRSAAYTEELSGTLNRAGRLGRLYLYSTPKGPSGLFWEEAKRIVGGERELLEVENRAVLSADGLGLYVHADSFQNEFLTPEQLRGIRAEEARGAVFEQERLARFVILDVAEDPVFRREWLERVYSPHPVAAVSNVVVGIDVSRFGADSTVFVVLDYDSGQVLRVERYATTSGPEIVAHVIRLSHEFGLATHFVMDATQHQAFLADFLPPHLHLTPLKVYEKDKERLVLGLRTLMQLGRVRIPHPEAYPFRTEEDRRSIRALIREALEFQRIVDSRGRVRYSHPTSVKHDDTLTALMLACDPILRGMTEEPLSRIPEDFRAIAGL